MPLIETSAIVLRTIDFGESDRVVTLMGRTVGCVGAMARGARKSQRRFGGGLGLCSIGDAGLRERSGSELFTLERFDVTASHPSLAVDIVRIAHAACAAELVTKLCAPRQPEPAIFDLLKDFLDVVDAQGATSERLRIFELALLDRLGLAPVLDACVACGRDDLSVDGEIDVRWDPERGGVVCRACGSRGRPMRPIVRLALSHLAGSSVTDLATPSKDLPSDVARGCRDALHELLATHLSAPLRSLEFLAKVTSDVDIAPASAPIADSRP